MRFRHLLCLLFGSLAVTSAQSQTAVSNSDFDTTCTFLMQGPSSPTSASITRAEIDCTGSNKVQMRIAPVLNPFQSAFTGKYVSWASCLASSIAGGTTYTSMACDGWQHLNFAVLMPDGYRVQHSASIFNLLHTPFRASAVQALKPQWMNP